MAIYIALGANQNSQFDNRENTPSKTFSLVFNVLENRDIHVSKVSGLWESPAWPDPKAQPAYKNAVIEVNTSIEALHLLKTLKDLEYAFGRREGERNAARPLDLDILDYSGQQINKPGLTLPHPRMCDRPFVLFPLYEVAPDWRDPIKNRTIIDWIARLEQSEVKPLKRLGKIA